LTRAAASSDGNEQRRLAGVLDDEDDERRMILEAEEAGMESRASALRGYCRRRVEGELAVKGGAVAEESGGGEGGS
jgi:hypothetical protein